MTTQEIQTLARIHAEARDAYQAGCRGPGGIANTAALEFLKTIGTSPQFLFDCVDDHARYGEPDVATFLALCEIRGGYFREVMKGAPAPRTVEECELPPKKQEFDGIAWLPRIIRKAQCFLTGCLCPDIMYGCAGDRAFLAGFKVSLPDFLNQVRETDGNPVRLAAFLRVSEKASP
ncbi:MAG: hypothetical protein ACO3GO_01865 [Terrimicrobiaceae bacterium]